MKFSVMCPHDGGEYNLKGQIIPVELSSSDSIASVKDQLQVTWRYKWHCAPRVCWPSRLHGRQHPGLVLHIFACAAAAENVQAALGGMPSSKMQLKSWVGFLKDTNTLAACNIGPGDVIEMLTRTRGGRR